MTNLEKLYLDDNDALEKPPGCPVGDGAPMAYQSEGKVAAFLRCLA